MRDTQAPSASVDRVGAVAWYVLKNPWEVFVRRWNWKAALLSAIFRGAAFVLPMTKFAGIDAWRALCIEMAFRVAIGGFWGSLLQAFRRAQPAWLAAVFAAIIIPGAAHCLEFAALRAGRATHVFAVMIVSVVITAGSLLINFGLMRKGLLIAGGDGESLASDFRRLPAALASLFRGLAGIV